MTLDIYTLPDVAGTADRVQSVLNDVTTSISNSKHYPAGVFDSMEVAVIPDVTYFFVLNVRSGVPPSLFQGFTYEMAALVVKGLRLWLTTYAGTGNWPTAWVRVYLDGNVIGILGLAEYSGNDTVSGAIELPSGVPVPPAVAMPLTLPMGFVSAQSSAVEVHKDISVEVIGGHSTSEVLHDVEHRDQSLVQVV